MISVDSISKSFRGTKGHFWTKNELVLDKVSFSIQRAKVTGFLGANGAGKTTLLKIMLGFIDADSGTVSFDDELGVDFRDSIGYLPERPYFYPNLTGLDFVRLMSELSNNKQNIMQSNINLWAPKLRIDFALNRKISTYSKGMLQRLGILSSIIHNPKLIILDEPLSGVDPIGRKELKDIILELKNSGTTVFFSSHILSDIEEICDEIIFLKDKKVQYAGRIEDLLLNNNNEVEIVFKHKSIVNLSFSSRELNEDLYRVITSEDQKDTIIKEILDSGGQIQRVTPIRKTLEETIYFNE